jgi:hypothetical protein
MTGSSLDIILSMLGCVFCAPCMYFYKNRQPATSTTRGSDDEQSDAYQSARSATSSISLVDYAEMIRANGSATVR